ncbi:MAG: dTMP kinase [Lentihominibacter sp.]
MNKGYFISFEGVDGSGKSTQILWLKEYLEKKGFKVLLTREPGGTEIGEKIRSIILDPQNSKMTAVTEAMLYAASRAQHVEEVIKPAIEAGTVVICDRFVDSSIAYQGYGRGLGESVEIINRYAVAGCMPDVTFLMKVKPVISGDRIRNRQLDRIEQENSEFHQAVYNGYEKLENEFSDRIISIDAARSIDEIRSEIINHVRRLIG